MKSPTPGTASLLAAIQAAANSGGGSGATSPEGAGGSSRHGSKPAILSTLQEVPSIPGLAPTASGQTPSLPASPMAERRSSWEDLRNTAEGFNSAGVQHLREGNNEEGMQLLKRAQALLDQWEEPVNPSAATSEHRLWLSLQADTAGNLGIYYRKIGDPQSALQSLQRSLKFHSAAGSALRTVAAVHLNLATCLLEAGAPAAESLRHAQAAVDLGGQLLAAPAAASGGSLGGEGEQDLEGTVVAPSADDCAMLAVAYHKLAESFECAREWSKASHAYTQAYEVVRRSLGPHHHLTKAFEKSSRCPRRNVQVPSLPITAARLTTPRRLPSIPRTRPAISQPPNSQRSARYEITGEVFARWPPEKASKEERQWYRMATKR